MQSLSADRNQPASTSFDLDSHPIEPVNVPCLINLGRPDRQSELDARQVVGPCHGANGHRLDVARHFPSHASESEPTILDQLPSHVGTPKERPGPGAQATFPFRPLHKGSVSRAGRWSVRVPSKPVEPRNS